MTSAETVHICLEEPFRQSAARGEHNFINLVTGVLQDAGMQVQFCALGEAPAAGYSLSHMVQPPNARGLVFRRAYHYPFWQIDAVAQRWHWDVARATFDPAREIPEAAGFYRFWQKRLFGEAARHTRRDGFVYVPLQGQLDRARLFQSCTPFEMIEACLAHDPSRRIVATLHPSETYDPADLKRLEALAARHGRLTVDTGRMEHYLAGCDYVVTQNSGAAFSGFFFGKPALLFAQIDFHHICIRAEIEALGASFAQVATAEPAFDRYLWWYWQEQSINAGRPEAAKKIAARFRRFGWPIP